MENIGKSPNENETFLDYLRNNGYGDIREVFETLVDGLPKKSRCSVPFLELGKDGDLYLSMMLFGRKSSEDGTNEFLWKDSVSERVSDEGDVAEASQRLAKKILERFPEIKTRVRMLLELKGYDTGWILSDD